MRTRQEYIDLLRSHANVLRSRYGIRSIRLFGSVARNEHHEGSDIDLFVDMPPKCLLGCAAADYMEDILGCHVDIIRNRPGIRPFIRQQIEKDGINVFSTI